MSFDRTIGPKLIASLQAVELETLLKKLILPTAEPGDPAVRTAKVTLVIDEQQDAVEGPN